MSKKWVWGVSRSLFGKSSHDKTVEICNYAGLGAVEADRSFVEGKTDQEITRIGQIYKDGGITIASLHLPMGDEGDAAAFYETERREVVALHAKMIQQTALLECSVAVLHPSCKRYTVDTEGLDRYLDALGRSLEVLLPCAEKAGVTIVLENMLPGDGGDRLGSDPNHFRLFTEKFAHKMLGYCLDTGHANVARGPEGPGLFIEAMGERLVHYHLVDNAGDRDSHLAPGHGLVDWKTVFSHMTRSGYDRPAIIEAPPFGYGPHNTYSPDTWRAFVRDADDLAKRSEG